MLLAVVGTMLFPCLSIHTASHTSPRTFANEVPISAKITSEKYIGPFGGGKMHRRIALHHGNMSNQGLGLKKRLNLLCKKPNKASDEEKYITTCRCCSVPLSVVSNKHGKLIAHDNHRAFMKIPNKASDEEKYITTCRCCSVPLSVVSNKHGKLIAHDNHRELS
jgi:hypothetical protein